MKKIIFSFFFGLFLLTASQEVYAQEHPQPKISFEIETIMAVDSSRQNIQSTYGDHFFAQNQLNTMNIERIRDSYSIRAKFHFLTNNDFQKWYNSEATKKLIGDLKEESKSWKLQYRKIP